MSYISPELEVVNEDDGSVTADTGAIDGLLLLLLLLVSNAPLKTSLIIWSTFPLFSVVSKKS